MNFCNNDIVLTIIMYTKYICLILLLILILLRFSRFNKRIFDNILLILIFAISFYILLWALSYIFEFRIINCFSNSNPIKMDISKSYYKSYNSKEYLGSPDNYLGKLTFTDKKELKNNNMIYVYNQNEFPISNVEYTFNDNYDVFTLKKAGNEITTLSSLISSILMNTDIDPLRIIEDLKYNGFDYNKAFNMDEAVVFLANTYNLDYEVLERERVKEILDSEKFILARTNGNSSGNIFTCSSSYIILYKQEKNKYGIISTNDKDYDYFCPAGTNGFGNYIKKNLNQKSYDINDLTNNIDEFIAVWRGA